MRHLLLPLLCVLTLAACGESESDAPTVTTVAVERGDVAAAVTAGGTLQALVTVQVGSQVSGRIASLEADYNSIVKKGDVVARIDPLQQQAAVRRTEANVAAAKGNLAKSQAAQVDAERQLRRARELLPQGYVSQAEIDTLATALEQAQAEVAAQRGALAQPHDLALEVARFERAGEHVTDLVGIDRLRQVVVRAELCRLDGGPELAIRRHHDHRTIGESRPQLDQEIEPRRIRQLDVERDQIRLERHGLGERGAAVDGGVHLERVAEQRAHQPATRRIVVHDE